MKWNNEQQMQEARHYSSYMGEKEVFWWFRYGVESPLGG
jgi:hypothetical protein